MYEEVSVSPTDPCGQPEMTASTRLNGCSLTTTMAHLGESSLELITPNP